MIQAIDVHGHVGRYDPGAGTVRERWFSATAEDVMRRARKARVKLTVVSALEALFLWGGDVSRGNEQAREAAEDHPEFLFWAVLDPRAQASFQQVESLLTHPRCAGIKIHPVLHKYDIQDYGDAVFEFAAAHHALVQTHCGEPGAFPEQFVPFLDRWQDVTLILSHLGCDSDGSPSPRHLAAVRRSQARNAYVDTSSANSIYSGVIEAAVAQIGPERILFGTDTPLHNVGAQRARIAHAEISRQAKQAILAANAERLLGAKCGATAGRHPATKPALYPPVAGPTAAAISGERSSK